MQHQEPATSHCTHLHWELGRAREHRRVPAPPTRFGGTAVTHPRCAGCQSQRKDRGGSGRSGWVARLAQAGVTLPAPWVPRAPGRREAQAPAALRAPSAVWAGSTYVRYTHIYVCLRIYTHTYMRETIIDTHLHIQSTPAITAGF